MKKMLMILFFLACNQCLALDSTLDHVVNDSQINIGYRNYSIPYSFKTKAMEAPAGYSIDICLQIVQAIKKKLNKPDIRVNFIEVNGSTRIPMIADGKIDLECGSTTHSLEREKFVHFTKNIYIDSDQAIVKKESGIRSLFDLTGKKIAVAGSSSVTAKIRSFEVSNHLKIGRDYVKDHQEGFNAVDKGEAVAYIELQSILAGAAANTGHPEIYAFLDQPIDAQPIAIMVRKGNTETLQIANSTIDNLAKSGELLNLFDKWFAQQIPALDIKLGLMLSDTNANLFKEPNSTPAEDDSQIYYSIYRLPIYLWGSAIVFFFLLISLLLLALLYKKYPVFITSKGMHSQMLTTVVNVITALTLAFTLSTCLSEYSFSSNLVLEEANAIAVIQKNTISLNANVKSKVTDLLKKYVQIVVDKEWPDQREGLPVLTYPGNASLSDLNIYIDSIENGDGTNVSRAKSVMLNKLNDLYKLRSSRLIAAESASKIPSALWIMILVSSTFSIISACLISFDSKIRHYFMVGFLSTLLGLFIVLIMAVNKPYIGQKGKGISSEPFEIVMENFI